MTCTVTVDMTGILAKLDTMNAKLAIIADALSTNTYSAVAGSVPAALLALGSFSASASAAIISNEFSVNLGTGAGDLENQVKLLRQALVPDGFHLTLSERIAADQAPSLAQRIVDYPEADPFFLNIGTIGDRIGPTPTDSQADATDQAWTNSPGTQNLAEALYDLGFWGDPVPGGLPPYVPPGP